MPEPEEVILLERGIKALQQQLVTLRLKTKDLIVARNKLTVEMRETEEEVVDLRHDMARVLSADIIEMFRYADLREELEANICWIEDGRNKLAAFETQLKVINNEIPQVEAQLVAVRRERAEWGEVLPFKPRHQ